MVDKVGVPAEPVIFNTSKARGAELTSSHEEAKAALLLTLDWARVNCPTERISICSDNQPLLKAIQSGAFDTVKGGAANTRTLAAEMPKPRCPPATHLW